MKQLPTISSISEKRVAYLSTYPPRECGIATFTNDLLDAADELNELKPSVVIALKEKETIYNYGKRVKWQIERDCVDDYRLYVSDELTLETSLSGYAFKPSYWVQISVQILGFVGGFSDSLHAGVKAAKTSLIYGKTHITVSDFSND